MRKPRSAPVLSANEEAVEEKMNSREKDDFVSRVIAHGCLVRTTSGFPREKIAHQRVATLSTSRNKYHRHFLNNNV